MGNYRLDLSEMIASQKDYFAKVDSGFRRFFSNSDCRKGCSYCCAATINSTLVEIIGIVDHLNKKNDLSFETLSKNLFSFNERYEDLFVQTPKNHIDIGSQDTGSYLVLRDRLLGYCPFLIDDECYIYKMRPLVCRLYFSESKEVCSSRGKPEVLDDFEYREFIKKHHFYLRHIDKLFLNNWYKHGIISFNPNEAECLFPIARLIYPERGDYIVQLPGANIKLSTRK